MTAQKVVVVEDDMIIQMFLSRVLTSIGFEVLGEARTCNEVLEIVAKNQPDLILMDVGIAGDKDGIETAELLNEKYDIPIIFITGNSDQSTIERAKKVNPVEFIFKPIDEDRLKDKVLNYKRVIEG
jgi:response regulator of citrate/malate metabolism